MLLMAEVNFIDPKDPRFVATVDALERALCDGPYMRRYEAPDDFGKPETAFNICTFWRIDALARIGRKAQVRVVVAADADLGIIRFDKAEQLFADRLRLFFAEQHAGSLRFPLSRY